MEALRNKKKIKAKAKVMSWLKSYFTSIGTKSINLNNGTSVHKSMKYSEWIEDSNCKLMDLCGLRAIESFYP